ncbi:MAG: neutral/alkaline non-lysosomal ceramidase N-terminal domain-containing protein [Traorella sp.]
MISLGFDRQCITPQLPFRLFGYEIERIATEVHDHLYTRCLLIDHDGSFYVLAQCDLLGFDISLIDEVYQRVSDLPIEKNHISIFATHTHSGPGGLIDTVTVFSGMQDIFGEYDMKLKEAIADKISLAIHRAFLNRLETKITIARGNVENVGAERHDIHLKGDNSLLVFKFTRKDGKEILLYNFACHPTVAGSSNTMVSADFPYAVERDLNYDMVMFINGAAGNISTRFTRESCGFNQIDIFSKRIIEAINKALEKPLYDGEWNYITMNYFHTTLPLKEMPPIEVARKRLNEYERQLDEAKKKHLSSGDLRFIESFVEGASIALHMAMALQNQKELEVAYTIIQLQNVTIAVACGELFSTLGEQLKEVGIDVFAYGNGYYMYLADEKAYERGFYEAMCSPFRKGAIEIFVKEMKERGLELCQK